MNLEKLEYQHEQSWAKAEGESVFKDAAELTADVAIKFCNWSYGEWPYEDSRFYHETSMGQSLTEEQAFDYFINNIYQYESK